MNTAVCLLCNSHIDQMGKKHTAKNRVFLMHFGIREGSVVRQLLQCMNKTFPEFRFRQGKQVPAVFGVQIEDKALICIHNSSDSWIIFLM
nr:MAG TPA: hypothetical protein [Caudoviricetes sp.]